MTTNCGSPLAKGETLTKGETAMIDKQTGKLIARIAENLPTDLNDDTMQGWIDNPRGLQKFLRGLCPPSTFTIWKTIKLGTGPKTADDFRRALKKGDCHISDWGNDILCQTAFTVSETEVEVNLINVSVAELGFKNGATRQDIYKRAKELGLELAPAEVGPQLRLQYPDQPRGEWLLVGMEPITDSVGDLGVFCVEHGGGGRWLYGYGGDPDLVWFGDRRWVFVSRK